MVLPALFKNFRPSRLVDIFLPYIKHCLHCLLLACVMLSCQYILIGNNMSAINPWTEYGYIGTFLLYFSRLTTLLSFPQTFFNFCGLVFYNAFREPVKLKGSPLTAPFICVRVVTRGDYPGLVKNNILQNFDTCRHAQLKNFMIQVVTDKKLGIEEQVQIKEVVVPVSYHPKSGALFKARALQYCLEGHVGNYLSDSDWIVHLDEETLLTANCVRGILNFVMDGSHQFGQGLITYSHGHVVNWLTTSADNFRVAEDMGKLRFQFKCFNKPLFCWKGSFVVAQVGAEKKVSFDNGPEGSVAEDAFFAIKAYQEGFSFDFIEGEMWEKSPFTILDFIQQRKRWIQGILLVVQSKKLSFRYKFFVTLSCYSWAVMPVTTAGAILRIFYPFPFPYFLEVIFVAILSVYFYLYIFGVIKTFAANHFSFVKILYFLCVTVLAIPVNAVMENIAVIWGLLGNNLAFYIVKKDTNSQVIV